MTTYAIIGLAALGVFALIGGLIAALIASAKDQQKAKDQIKDQDVAKQQAEIIAEHRDPDRVSDRLRSGSF